MSMRQLHENDPMRISITDRDGQRQGIVLERHGQWCWVIWQDSSAPVTEHEDDLWIPDDDSLQANDLYEFVRAWAPREQLSPSIS